MACLQRIQLIDWTHRMEFQLRHEGHHHKANLKYGYAIFGLSLIAALVLAICNHVYLRKWEKMGTTRPKSVWARLGSPEPVWLHVLMWLITVIVLSVLNVHEIKENYPTIIKRVGRLSFYLVPFDILLAMRPSLMATSYLEYISLHKWILRLLLILAMLHGVGYSIKWISTGNFWEKAFRTPNLLGVIIFFVGLTLIILSLRPVRRRFYRMFYLWHNFTVAAFLIPILWHARPGVADAVFLSLLLVVFQIVQRIRGCYQGCEVATFDKDLSSLSLYRLTLPENFPSEWHAGAHIRISYPPTDVRYWLSPSHPFTIFSLPDDKSLDFVVKKTHRFQIHTLEDYSISSPFSSLPPPFFQTAENVIILCGGSGVSLGVPVLRILSSNSSVKSELHWSISKKADSFVLESVQCKNQINVYVTEKASMMQHQEIIDISDQALLSNSEPIELEALHEYEGQRSGDVDEKSVRANGVNLKFHTGRPNLNNVFAPLLEGDNKNNCWIVVCGPKSMIDQAKLWGKSHGILVFLELYDF